MSVAQMMELVKKLSNGKTLSEETAVELLDYIENPNGVLATKQDIEDIKQDMRKELTELKKLIIERTNRV